MDCVGGITGGSNPGLSTNRLPDAGAGGNVSQMSQQTTIASQSSFSSTSMVSQSSMSAHSLQAGLTSLVAGLGQKGEEDGLLRFLLALILMAALQQQDAPRPSGNEGNHAANSMEYLSMTSVQSSVTSVSIQQTAYSGQALSGGGSGNAAGGDGGSQLDVTA